VLPARLAEVHVKVDEPGRDHESARVHDLGAVGRVDPHPHLRHQAVDEEDVEERVDPARRVDHPPAPDQRRLHRTLPPFAASAVSGSPPASRYSTAMRTATPFVTCSRITECGPSATA